MKHTRAAGTAELRLNGLAGGRLTETVTSVPGTSVAVVLSEFVVPASATPPAPFAWRLQDVGSPQWQLEVAASTR